jgi:hypothetical protein
MFRVSAAVRVLYLNAPTVGAQARFNISAKHCKGGQPQETIKLPMLCC